MIVEVVEQLGTPAMMLVVIYMLNRIERKSERMIDILHRLNGGGKK